MVRAFDRVLLIRHLALCAGAAVAYVLRSELRVGVTVLWIVGISAVLNFAAYGFRTRPAFARACELASPMIGLGGWSALIAVTGGVGSPFVAGLWLEVVLSAMALPPVGIAAVTVGAVTGLWGQQLWLGVGNTQALALQTGFLYAAGGVTFAVARRFRGAQHELARQQAQLDRRLGDLERELEDERMLGRVGESAARLAHSLKNTVHSLRGFVGLIEPKLEQGDGGQAALAGLRATIDDLETLARVSLGSPDPAREGQSPGSALAQVRSAVDGLAARHPDIEWQQRGDGTSPSLALPPSDVVEVLLIVLQNAVEAMSGRGRVSVATASEGDWFRVSVLDRGPGIPDAMRDRLFAPGETTKTGGSGYGLFLARRILEERGGRLVVDGTADPGTRVDVLLPIRTGTSPGAPA